MPYKGNCLYRLQTKQTKKNQVTLTKKYGQIKEITILTTGNKIKMSKKVKEKKTFNADTSDVIVYFMYFTRHLNVELKIRPDIRYPALRYAEYPAKSISGTSLINIDRLIWA
jgi:hypothetical protein